MLRILLFLVVGFALNRLHILPKGSGVGISRLVTNLFLPALLLHSNMTEFNPADVGEYGMLVLTGGLFWGTFTLLGMFVAKRLSKGDLLKYGIYQYSLSFPNTGAVAMPLLQAFLGNVGVFQYGLFALPMTIMTYAWGVELFLDVERKNPIKRFFTHLLNPVFIALVIGLGLGALGAKNWMPPLVIGAVGDLRNCYVPVSLILTGYMIAEHPLKDAFLHPKSYLVIALRLVIFPLLVLGAVWLFRCSSMVATLAMLAFASPCGMNVVLFPAAYGKDCRTGVSLVLPSSLGAILTVPLLYALLQQVIG
jgi:predicted permease